VPTVGKNPAQIADGRTTDLVFGSTITFTGPTSHSLRGIPGDWRVFSVDGT
jgi:hypothetical protein